MIMNHRGLLTCTRYAFPPNALHYCGPEKQVNLNAYQKEQIADYGLQEIIEQFETLFPYLSLIAYENNIRDPFDPRVVEAYWIGNDLLKNVSMNTLYYHLRDTLKLKKKVKPKDLELLFGKLDDGMLPHHTFHVVNVFTRTSHHSIEHTVETMDACRISWGKMMPCSNPEKNTGHPEQSKGSTITVLTKPLIIQNGKLAFGKPTAKSVITPPHIKLKTDYRKPLFVSFHWNTLCDIITEEQGRRLEWYTNQAIQLANKTV
jgi:hypothetical protein